MNERARAVARNDGFTLVEVSIILLTLVILSTIMLPQMGGFNRLARYARVKEDLGAICSVLKQLLDDVGESAFYGDAGAYDIPDRYQPIGLLVGEGDAPMRGSAADGELWLQSFGDEFGVETDGRGMEPWFWVDSLGNHLISNTPLGDADNRWRGPLDMRRGFNSLFYWRGPYISDEVMPDPWGNRYLVNAFALHNPVDAGPYDRFSSAVVCLSAGPDSGIDTDFNQPNGWRTGDDDYTAVLHAGGPM